MDTFTVLIQAFLPTTASTYRLKKLELQIGSLQVGSSARWPIDECKGPRFREMVEEIVQAA